VRTETKKLLTRGIELVRGVPYRVSLRWVFYALFQEGLYGFKDHDKEWKVRCYKRWKAMCSRYRKQFAAGWDPTTLADDTRERIRRHWGAMDLKHCLADLVEDTVESIDFAIDHFFHQKYYVEVWFEAKAMAGQFEYFTKGVDLLPFGGDPSIPFKWSIAKQLEEARRRYRKPIVVLYFGDYDKHGLEILESAEADIRAWSKAQFEIVRCGLTEEQVEKYSVPDNPSKPGDYQWEALSHEGAEEVITTSLAKYLDLDTVDKLREESEEQEEHWKLRVREVMEKLVEEELE